MAKKETTKPKKDSELDDSIPLRVSHGERADIGVARGIRACRDDKPESPRKRRIPKVEDDYIRQQTRFRLCTRPRSS